MPAKLGADRAVFRIKVAVCVTWSSVAVILEWVYPVSSGMFEYLERCNVTSVACVIRVFIGDFKCAVKAGVIVAFCRPEGDVKHFQSGVPWETENTIRYNQCMQFFFRGIVRCGRFWNLDISKIIMIFAWRISDCFSRN